MIRRLRLLFIFIFIVCCTIISARFFDGYFRVREIYVEGTDTVNGINDYKAKNILLLRPRSIENTLLKNNKTFDSVRVEVEIPDTLRVAIVEKTPISTLEIKDGYVIFAADNTILAKSKSDLRTDLPIMSNYQPYYYSQFIIGSVFDAKDIKLINEFLKRLEVEDITIRSIDILNENMILLHTESYTVQVTADGDAERQFNDFIYTVRQLKEKNIEFDTLDVRFDKPIVTEKNI